MNKDAIVSIIVKVLLVICSPLATKYGIDGDTLTSAALWVATGLVGAYGIYDHWNMKKVPENSTAIILPKNDKPVPGTTIDLTPMRGTAKVVG